MAIRKTELLDKITHDGDERIMLARVLDKMELAQSRGTPSHTFFLSPGQRVAVESLISACGHPRHVFCGGFDGAERTVCLFLPDWQDEEDALTDPPLRALRCAFPEGSGLSHRDFLGSLLGLGINREKLGDFLVNDGFCDIILLPEIQDFLLTNLESAGRVRLRVQPIDLADIRPPQPQIKIIRDTVAALRLDAVTASGFSVSRTRAAEFISSGRVQLNHRECLKGDRVVAAGDVISCRGLGKFRLTEVGGLSKKGRTVIVIERYI